MKRFLAAVVCAVGVLASTPAQAAPILTTDTNGVVGAVIFDLVLNPVATALVPGGASTVTISDGPVIAAGVIATSDDNTTVFVDFGLDDAYVFEFNFATSIFNANLWSMIVDGIPLVASDPALVPFVGTNIGQFSALTFDPFFGDSQQQVGYIATYKLDFIAAQDATPVPEPATLGLVAMGLAAAVRRRRQQNKKA